MSWSDHLWTQCVAASAGGFGLAAIGRELAELTVVGVISPELLLVDLDADAGLLDPAPARPVGDRQPFGQDIVPHHLRRLLMAEPGIWGRDDEVVAGRGRQPELPMGVLAQLPALHMADPVERMEAR